MLRLIYFSQTENGEKMQAAPLVVTFGGCSMALNDGWSKSTHSSCSFTLSLFINFIPWPWHNSCRKGVCGNVWFVHHASSVHRCIIRTWKAHGLQPCASQALMMHFIGKRAVSAWAWVLAIFLLLGLKSICNRARDLRSTCWSTTEGVDTVICITIGCNLRQSREHVRLLISSKWNLWIVQYLVDRSCICIEMTCSEEAGIHGWSMKVQFIILCTVEPAHVATCTRRPPALSGHFLWLP